MKKKIVEVVKGNKTAVAVSLTAMATILSTCPVFAGGENELSLSSQVSSALETGLNTAVSDFVGYVALVVPIGLTVFGATFGVKKAMSFFKTLSSK